MGKGTMTDPAASMLFPKVVIAGVGFMGGSLGRTIKARGLARQVVGWTRRPAAVLAGRKAGALDSGTQRAEEAVRDADLLVLAGPVESTPLLLQEAMPYLPKGCLVTDLGSTKAGLMVAVRNILRPSRDLPKVYFVGSHPMAGSEKSGVAFSREDLYQGSTCILIRESWTHAGALARLQAFWEALGCGRILVMTALEHDYATAFASHLPHALAAGLINTLAEAAERDPRVAEVASTGFLDTTRVAGGPAAMWTGILLSNRKELARALESAEKKIGQLRTLLETGKEKKIFQLLNQAQQFRQAWEEKRRGA